MRAAAIAMSAMTSLLYSLSLSTRCAASASSRPSRIRTLPRISALRTSTLFSSSTTTSFTEVDTGNDSPESGDLLLAGLNAARDISVKVVSCREIVQDSIIRQDLSPDAATALGEVVTCALMMGAGLKDDETLQVNLVGQKEGGLRNVMAITDGELKVRGMVGNSRFASSRKYDGAVKMRDMLGEGQVQVVRNHPSWRFPSNGIIQLRDVKIALNLALYLAESEQRTSVLLSDVSVEGSLCRHAIGLLVERLPGAEEGNIETSIRNLEKIERKTLRGYLERKEGQKEVFTGSGGFRDFGPVLGRILDDTLEGLGEDFRWSKTPKFRCSCGIDKIWQTLRLLPKDEIRSIIEAESVVEIKCEFCSQKYSVTREQIVERILEPSEPQA